MGAIVTESDTGRGFAPDIPRVRLSEETPESRFDLTLLDIENVETEDLTEEANINGWIVVCEVTEARDRSDIQS